MASSRKAAARPVPDNFENALDELEQLVARMESGELALDALLENYQRGAQLISFCRDKLKTVEQQVQVLEGGELKPLISGDAQ
ncbi:exodeoxyribonuclease VII small subunit [Saezia sanguinis]|uniref:exodeoxyribonuclease VII small subunit n=1 Tax=Saezia sanguinis TaxID=1965230 RepID=UPI003042A336